MSTRNLFAVVCVMILLVLAIVVSCGGGGSSGLLPATVTHCYPAGVNPTLVVSAVTGSNTTADGTCDKPYKTISAAIASYVSGSTIWVAPGTYDTALGEVFPIIVPAGVALIGDEANKGKGSVNTEIIGNGQYLGALDAAVEPLTGATIAGLIVSATTVSAGQLPVGIIVNSNNVTIRNNHIVNSLEYGLYILNGSQQVITGNIMQNNNWGGIIFRNTSGSGAKIEHNRITDNKYGIEVDSAAIGMDIGGGAAGSAGLNILSCNTFNDVWSNTTGTISAMNNIWDHVPPSGNDIWTSGTVTFITTGATVSTYPCL